MHCYKNENKRNEFVKHIFSLWLCFSVLHFFLKTNKFKGKKIKFWFVNQCICSIFENAEVKLDF